MVVHTIYRNTVCKNIQTQDRWNLRITQVSSFINIFLYFFHYRYDIRYSASLFLLYEESKKSITM